ncbi:MAG: OmpH family outer membrane protein [Hyphomonadaceae bacterium]
MTRIKFIFAAMVLAFAGASVCAPIAAAQGTTVVVIDQRVIMRDSLAGKAIQAKLKSIEDQITNELRPTAASLETESTALQTRTATMTEQAVLADAALKTRFESFYTKAGEFNQLRQRRTQELALTERKAWGDFFAALQPILQQVVSEKSAGVMLDRNSIVYSAPAVDVTALVISKLDASTPTIAVTRQTVPAQ